jgi:amino acid transporter
MCVLLQVLFSLLAYMCVSNGAMNVFWWFVDLTAAGTLVSWITIALNHIRLLQAMDKQGIPGTALPWHNRITSVYLCDSVKINHTDSFQDTPAGSR